MTKNDLVEKLRDMRDSADDGDLTAMTHLFGIIFNDDISECGTNAAQIAQEYNRRHTKIGGEPISDGRKLARFVTVPDRLLRKWR